MKKSSHGLKPTCSEVHRLVSEGMDRDLSPVERGRLHLLVCIAGTRFSGQMTLLRGAMHAFPLDGSVDAGEGRQP